jgi:chorismate mutase
MVRPATLWVFSIFTDGGTLRGLNGCLLVIALLIWGENPASSNTDPSLHSLVETSAQRLLIAQQVALAKWDSGASVEDAHREALIIQSAVKDGNASGLDSTQVELFFKAQLEASKLVQYSLLADWERKGGAPPHAPVDLVKEIRPRLDEIDKQLIAELLATFVARSAKNCNVNLAKAVGEYLDARKLKADTRDAVALERALATTCAR